MDDAISYTWSASVEICCAKSCWIDCDGYGRCGRYFLAARTIERLFAHRTSIWHLRLVPRESRDCLDCKPKKFKLFLR